MKTIYENLEYLFVWKNSILWLCNLIIVVCLMVDLGSKHINMIYVLFIIVSLKVSIPIN